MTCRDVMTPDPSCCLATDSAQTAAQLMKSRDVGQVPIVDDHLSRRLVGVVTDRDLAIRVVAEGTDPRLTRLDQLMSTDLVMVRPNDSLETAMERMARYQVRRVPVVDDSGRLVGIVAQADIARNSDQRHVGEIVEEISEPPGSVFGRTTRRLTRRVSGAMERSNGNRTWLIATASARVWVRRRCICFGTGTKVRPGSSRTEMGSRHANLSSESEGAARPNAWAGFRRDSRFALSASARLRPWGDGPSRRSLLAYNS